MKKIVALAGIAAMLGLFNVYAGGIANPESLNARDAVLDADKTSSDSPAATACPKGMTCPKAATCPKGMTCSKGTKASASCPKAKGKSKADASCPVAKDGARTCPVTGATGKTDKAVNTPEKPADKDAK